MVTVREEEVKPAHVSPRWAPFAKGIKMYLSSNDYIAQQMSIKSWTVNNCKLTANVRGKSCLLLLIGTPSLPSIIENLGAKYFKKTAPAVLLRTTARNFRRRSHEPDANLADCD
jgi:hypothetical protein